MDKKDKNNDQSSLFFGTIVDNSIESPKLTNNKQRKLHRIDADNYFMKIAFCAAERGTCRRHSVGAVLVKNKMILSTGYNGAPRGAKDCLELDCLRDKLGIKSGERSEICRAVHAEQNAVIQAAKNGVDTEESIMYCTHSPCNICAKIMANAGVKEVYISEKYADESFEKLFQELKIKINYMKRPGLKIDFYE